MNLARVLREAKEVKSNEVDERVVAARRLVLRDTTVATLIVLSLMVINLLIDREEFGWILWIFIVPGVAAIVAAISSWHHRSTTQEMDRARSIQMFFAIPGAAVVGGGIVGAFTRDIGEALYVALTVAVSLGIGALLIFVKSLRRKDAE